MWPTKFGYAGPILVRSDQFLMLKAVQADLSWSNENALAGPIFALDQNFGYRSSHYQKLMCSLGDMNAASFYIIRGDIIA